MLHDRLIDHLLIRTARKIAAFSQCQGLGVRCASPLDRPGRAERGEVVTDETGRTGSLRPVPWLNAE